MQLPDETGVQLVQRAYKALFDIGSKAESPGLKFVSHSVVSASFTVSAQLKLYKVKYFAWWLADYSNCPERSDCCKVEYYWADSETHALALLCKSLEDETYLDKELNERAVSIDTLLGVDTALGLNESKQRVGKLQ